ncbi:MAG: VOC family protein [Pseudonocardiaceae bacterium]
MHVTLIGMALMSGDPAASARWFVEHFGFRIGIDIGWYVNTQLAGHDNLSLDFVHRDHPSSPDVLRGKQVAGTLLAFLVDDVDAEHLRLREAGLRIVLPLVTEPWGQRRFQVTARRPGRRGTAGGRARPAVARRARSQQLTDGRTPVRSSRQSPEARLPHLCLALLPVHPLVVADLTEQVREGDEVAVVVSELGVERGALPCGMFGDHGHVLMLGVIFEVGVEAVGPRRIEHHQQQRQLVVHERDHLRHPEENLIRDSRRPDPSTTITWTQATTGG